MHSEYHIIDIHISYKYHIYYTMQCIHNIVNHQVRLLDAWWTSNLANSIHELEIKSNGDGNLMGLHSVCI